MHTVVRKMQNRLRIKDAAVICFIVVSLTLAQLPISAQTPRAKRPSRPSTPRTTPSPSRTDPEKKTTQLPAAALAQLEIPESQRVKLIRSPKSVAMAKAFDDGKLPEPLRLPPGNIDEQAATLAKAVLKGDEKSVPALYAAVLAAGYGIRDADGSVLETTDHGQGMVFRDWEIAAIAKLYGQGYGVGLAHLSEAFTRNTKAFKDVPLATALLDGIRKAANSDHRALRFWGRFIVELGRSSSEPYDLLDQIGPAKIRLDAAQMFFVLSRLMGDVALSAKVANHVRPVPSLTRKTKLTASNHAELSTLRILRNNRSSSLPGPCAPEGWESIGRDVGALAATSLYDHILSQSNMSLGSVNLVLTLLKFILSYAFLKTDIVIAKKPLVRTKSTTKGELDVVIGKVWIDNKLQELNCQRTFLNAHGLDFNLPNSGPVSGATIAWEGLEGFGEQDRGALTSALDYVRNLGEVPPLDEPIVTFDVLKGPWGGPSRTEMNTDIAGQSLILVVGLPQKKNLANQKLTEVNKVAGVMFRVQLKAIPKELNDIQGIASTLGDAAGPVIAFLQGDWVGGAVGVATEAAYRMAWRGSEPLYFVVKDWEPCEGWTGSIIVKGEFKDTRPTSTRTSSGTEETTKNYELRFNLTPVKDTSGGSQNGYFANLLATIEDSHVTVEKRNDSGFCDTGARRANGTKVTELVRGILTVTNRQERVGAGTVKATVYIAERGATGYNILINAPSEPVTGVQRWVMDYNFPQCPLWEKVNSNREERPEKFYLPQIEFLATFDPEHPGSLKGTQTVKDSRGGSVTYTWDLQQCK